MTKKKILYIDMDGVLADFESKLHSLFPETKNINKNVQSDLVDQVCQNRERRIFQLLPPMPFAQLAYSALCKHYDVYILSTPMWGLPESYTDKRIWVQQWLGHEAHKKLILSHNKGLLKGDYLIDDRLKNGVEEFEGEHIHFDTPEFLGWPEVLKYLSEKDGWVLDFSSFVDKFNNLKVDNRRLLND